MLRQHKFMSFVTSSKIYIFFLYIRGGGSNPTPPFLETWVLCHRAIGLWQGHHLRSNTCHIYLVGHMSYDYKRGFMWLRWILDKSDLLIFRF